MPVPGCALRIRRRRRWIRRFPESAGHAGNSRRDRRDGRDSARAGGMPTDHGGRTADRVPPRPRLCLLRGLPAARRGDRARRCGLGPDRQRIVHPVDRSLRSTTGRRRHLHRAVHHLWRGTGRVRCEQVLHRLVLRRLPALQGSAGPDRDPGRVSPWQCFGVGHGDHGQPRVGVLAGLATSRLPEGERGRNAGGRGHRRDPVPADIGRRGLHHRRISRRALSDGVGLGDRADHPVLPRHSPGRRDRRSQVWRHARSR